MQPQQKQSVADIMNAFDRARAIRETQSALRLAHFADGVAASARGALHTAGEAMMLVYGRGL